jgi:heme-degrading monooxygenase HmoA
MIARLWHGTTRVDRADAYSTFLGERAMPDYRGTPGNLGAQVLRRDEGDVAHFVTLSYWESEDAIRSFAGTDLLKPKYYPEDESFLLEFEPQVVHYEVRSAG